jgi:hypothetical protein
MANDPKARQLLSRLVPKNVWANAVAAVDTRKPLPLNDGVYAARVAKTSVVSKTAKDQKTQQEYEYLTIAVTIQYLARHVGQTDNGDALFTVIDKRREGDPKAGQDFRVDQCAKDIMFWIRETDTEEDRTTTMTRIRSDVLEHFFNIDLISSVDDFDPTVHTLDLLSAIEYLGNWNPYCLAAFNQNGKYQNANIRSVLADGEDAEGNPVNALTAALDAIVPLLGYAPPAASEERAAKLAGISLEDQPASDADVPFDTAPAPAAAPANAHRSTPAPAAPAAAKSKPPVRQFAPTPDDEAVAALVESTDPIATGHYAAGADGDAPSDDDALFSEDPEEDLFSEEPTITRLSPEDPIDDLKAIYTAVAKSALAGGLKKSDLPLVKANATAVEYIKSICSMDPVNYCS